MDDKRFTDWAASDCPGGAGHETTADATFWKTDCFACQRELVRSIEADARQDERENLLGYWQTHSEASFAEELVRRIEQR